MKKMGVNEVNLSFSKEAGYLKKKKNHNAHNKQGEKSVLMRHMQGL